MNVLLCHTFYQQRGGEDESFAAEARLLESRGHNVARYTLHNDAMSSMSHWTAARLTVWNPESYRQVRRLIRQSRPDVMHCTNTFPLMSPAVYYAARAEGVPVVQSLRNYRLFCPGALFQRDDRVCEDCLNCLVAAPAIRHGCYRGSRLASAAVAGMLTVHRMLGTWNRRVDLYFTLTRFARERLLAGGLSPGRVFVKPNFIDPDPGIGDGAGNAAIFVGRLSAEKGLPTLLAAWRRIGERLPLQIVGDGPLAGLVQEAARSQPGVTWLGRRPMSDVLDLVGRAKMLIMPSTWYETFGRTIIEAYAKGTPAVVSDLGAMAELVDHGVTGMRFRPGDSVHLAETVDELLAQPDRLAAMRIAARQAYEAKYTADRNYQMLMALYRRASAKHVGTMEEAS